MIELLAGLCLLIFGAELMVRAAVRLAARLHVRPLIIGLTIVALGSSAPQMAVSLQATLAQNADIAGTVQTHVQDWFESEILHPVDEFFAKWPERSDYFPATVEAMRGSSVTSEPEISAAEVSVAAGTAPQPCAANSAGSC